MDRRTQARLTTSPGRARRLRAYRTTGAPDSLPPNATITDRVDRRDAHPTILFHQYGDKAARNEILPPNPGVACPADRWLAIGLKAGPEPRKAVGAGRRANRLRACWEKIGQGLGKGEPAAQAAAADRAIFLTTAVVILAVVSGRARWCG